MSIPSTMSGSLWSESWDLLLSLFLLPAGYEKWLSVGTELACSHPSLHIVYRLSTPI